LAGSAPLHILANYNLPLNRALCVSKVMTKNQRIVFALISAFSFVALINGIEIVVVYYQYSEVVNRDAMQFIELSKNELMTMSKEQLVNALHSSIESSKEKAVLPSMIPTNVFYLILALVLSLKISFLYNLKLVKNTHNK